MQNPDITIGAPSPSVNLSEKDIARFWAKVDKNGPIQPHMDTPCWVWKASRVDGYGHIKIKGKMVKAHRASWEIIHGKIPHDGSRHGICVCHRCDVRECCNPSHLFLGTNAENVKDRDNKGRHKPLFGDQNGSRLHPEKSPKGERHGNSLLTASKVMEIRSLYSAGGITHRELGELFGVCVSAIGHIISRKNWRHI